MQGSLNFCIVFVRCSQSVLFHSWPHIGIIKRRRVKKKIERRFLLLLRKWLKITPWLASLWRQCNGEKLIVLIEGGELLELVIPSPKIKILMFSLGHCTNYLSNHLATCSICFVWWPLCFRQEMSVFSSNICNFARTRRFLYFSSNVGSSASRQLNSLLVQSSFWPKGKKGLQLENLSLPAQRSMVFVLTQL